MQWLNLEKTRAKKLQTTLVKPGIGRVMPAACSELSKRTMAEQVHKQQK
jgi:hypothetical protein